MTGSMESDTYVDLNGFLRWRSTGKIVKTKISKKTIEALRAFLEYVEDQWPIVDSTARPEDGDDTHYYELDARAVELALESIRTILKVEK